MFHVQSATGKTMGKGERGIVDLSIELLLCTFILGEKENCIFVSRFMRLID